MKLYSTGCPRCGVLKEKLVSKDIVFEEVDDINTMLQLGITQVPVLEVNGQLLEFSAAVKYVNSLTEATE